MGYEKRLKKILDKYSKKDLPLVKKTTEMLTSKGIPNGCYQDYGVISEVYRK